MTPTILATDLVTLLGSPDPGLHASRWVRAVGTSSFNPDSSTGCVLARAEENARALHPCVSIVVGGSRAELTFTVECGSWEGAMSEINRSGKMSE